MLTQRQQDALAFIRRYIREHGHGPTLTEVAHGLGMRSVGSVHRYVQAIADAGYIRLHAGRHRGIELLDDACGEYGDDQLPLVGKIAAGQPIEALENPEAVNLGQLFVGPNRYLLRVEGDSMVEAGILDGDLVVIESSDSARDGDIVVALIDDQEATLKRFKRHANGMVSLIPENTAMSALTYPAERVRIQGVLKGQLRTYH